MSIQRSVRQSYIDLRGLNLGAEFLRQYQLQPGQRYSVTVAINGLSDIDTTGTLDKSGFIGGLAVMYNTFALQDGDLIEVDYESGIIRLTPPMAKLRQATTTTTPAPTPVAALVFTRQSLRHIHIEPFAFGSLSEWVPHTEADVYLVFGTLSEYTDYRYVCGASKSLLDRLGYSAQTKPDAILIDRRTDEYLMGEFKMTSKDFTLNHQKDDVDVLVCWDHNETDHTKLPPQIVALKQLVDNAIRNGDLQL